MRVFVLINYRDLKDGHPTIEGLYTDKTHAQLAAARKGLVGTFQVGIIKRRIKGSIGQLIIDSIGDY